MGQPDSEPEDQAISHSQACKMKDNIFNFRVTRFFPSLSQVLGPNLNLTVSAHQQTQ